MRSTNHVLRSYLIVFCWGLLDSCSTFARFLPGFCSVFARVLLGFYFLLLSARLVLAFLLRLCYGQFIFCSSAARLLFILHFPCDALVLSDMFFFSLTTASVLIPELLLPGAFVVPTYHVLMTSQFLFFINRLIMCYCM